MITTELDRYEYTGSADPVVFRSGGTDIPIRNTAHVKVYVTTTGVFTADISSSTVNLLDTGHGHIDGQELTLSAATSLPTGLLANTIYYVVNKTTNTFQVSLSSGGDAVAFTTNGSGTLTWTKTLLKAISTDYTVALVGTTATVTWESGKVPGATDKVLFLRDVTFEQTTDLQNNSQFEAESVEGQLDLMVNMSQQLKNTSDRQFRFSNVLEASDATEASATLTATSAGRADKGLRFDSLGNLGVSTMDIDLAQDYILEAKSWATEDGIVQTYSRTVASNVSPVEYSAKDYAQGDADGGSSKEWAQDTSAAIDTTFSAKEYAQGTQASTGGSSKNWASQTGADITGGSSGDKSAKSWAIETGGTAPADGSAKEWATATGSAVASSEFSAKEYSQGVTATGGTAKQWALGGGSHVEATEVTSGLYSARKYASNASTSASASAASASAAEGYTDAFDDRYLGSKSSVPTEDNDTNPLTDGALYYNTTSNIMYVYDLGTTTWIALTIGELTTTGFAAATLVTQAEGIASNDNETTIPTSAAVKDYVDTSTATITSPVINTGVSGTAIKDEDDMSSDSATHLATQQSIKAYASTKWQDWDEIGDSTPRIDYDLEFRAPASYTHSYAGFKFLKQSDDSSAGYLLVKNAGDSSPYTADSISLVADTGHLNLIQKTSSSHGIKFYTGSSGTERMYIDNDGNIVIYGTFVWNDIVGMIAPFAMTSVPTGWLVCDGSAVSRTVTYSALFAAISTTWGVGDGSSTFNVPDLEGAFLRGTGSHGTSNMANGNDFAGPSVGAFENDQYQRHQHTVKGSDGLTVGYNAISGSGYRGIDTDQGDYNISPYIASSNGTFEMGAPRNDDETRPFNAGVKYCIKY